jgi:hypothetical protein
MNDMLTDFAFALSSQGFLGGTFFPLLGSMHGRRENNQVSQVIFS